MSDNAGYGFMGNWTVTGIGEPDFGCEEPPADAGELVEISLSSQDGTVTRRLEKEAYLTQNRITEGDEVCLDSGGALRRYVRVSAAAIIRDHQVLAAQRGHGSGKDRWEFPGGKQEKGETAREALEREIREELDFDVKAGDEAGQIRVETATRVLSITCFLCRVVSGEPHLTEHEAIRWLTADRLDSVDWLDGDRRFLASVKDALSGD